MKSKDMKRTALLFALVLVLWAGCENPAAESGTETPAGTETPTGPSPITGFDFEPAALVFGTGTIAAGSEAGRFVNVQGGNGEYTWELIAGLGAADISRFRIEGDALKIGDEELDYGPYSVRVRLFDSNHEYCEQVCELSVTLAPPPPRFVTASPGMNYIEVEWSPAPGADSYEIWYGISGAIESAQQFTGTITGDQLAGYSAVIPGLPDGTAYNVWVKSVNDLGESTGGRITCQRTSDTVDTLFLNGFDPGGLDYWNLGYDDYEFFYDENDDLVVGYLTGSGKSIAGIGAMGYWIVRYHASFDPVYLNEIAPHTTYGHYTTGEDLTGKPAGVFIVEMGGGQPKPYYAVYYWGCGAIQTAGSYDRPGVGGEPDIPGTHGRKVIYFSNAWAGLWAAAPPGYTPDEHLTANYYSTLREAILGFSARNFAAYIAHVAIPGYQYKDGQYNGINYLE